ncbi:hypothetical protein C8J57DRAFT_1545722 [Mycena rebaudengoi]|nr:hypothetical protein C8J57DRAFT_1545722 [Mycena rebaudengoi]
MARVSAQTRLALKTDEETEHKKAAIAQWRINAEVAGVALVTADREGKLQDWHITLEKKINKLRPLQAIYSPAATLALQMEEVDCNPNAAPVPVEKAKIWLPSELTVQQHAMRCQRGLGDMESRLHKSQCSDALANLQSRLHAK